MGALDVCLAASENSKKRDASKDVADGQHNDSDNKELLRRTADPDHDGNRNLGDTLRHARPPSPHVDLDRTQPQSLPRRSSSRSPLLTAGHIVASASSGSRPPSAEVNLGGSWLSAKDSRNGVNPEHNRSLGNSQELPRFGSRPPTSEREEPPDQVLNSTSGHASASRPPTGEKSRLREPSPATRARCHDSGDFPKTDELSSHVDVDMGNALQHTLAKEELAFAAGYPGAAICPIGR